MRLAQKLTLALLSVKMVVTTSIVIGPEIDGSCMGKLGLVQFSHIGEVHARYIVMKRKFRRCLSLRSSSNSYSSICCIWLLSCRPVMLAYCGHVVELVEYFVYARRASSIRLLNACLVGGPLWMDIKICGRLFMQDIVIVPSCCYWIFHKVRCAFCWNYSLFFHLLWLRLILLLFSAWLIDDVFYPTFWPDIR